MEEGNVGKDFALNEQKKSEKLTLETIKNLKIRPGKTIVIGGMEITNFGGQSTIKIEGIDIVFGILDEDGKFTFNRENFEDARKALEEKGLNLKELGLPDIKQWIDLEEQQEREELKRESKHWQEMDLGREFTDTEDLRKYINDVLGYHIGSGRLYRVRTGTHDFKYMVEKDGKYEELDLSSDFGGRNTREEIYILDEDGNFRREEVDSLLLTRDGNRGIATKLPDTGSSDVTKSFAVTREKGGKFVATQLIEKSGQNRDPNLPGKDRLDRGRGREEIGDDLDNIEEMENKDLGIADDGITVQEITLYEYLEKKGYKPETIDRMIKDIEENKISVEEAETKEEQREEVNGGRTPWEDAEGRRSRW